MSRTRITIGFVLVLLLCLMQVDISDAKGRRKKRVKRKYRGVVIKKVEPKPTPPDTVAPPKKDTLPNPVTIPVERWPQKKFRLLEKTKMFQQFGYELYTSPRFSEDMTPPDSRIEHANHRLKYDVFNGTTITATHVSKMDNGEYHVSFKTDTLDLTVYGKTGKGIIEGIALYSDFKAAEKRWKGKVIFSRRRSIETYDSTLSQFSSVKVSITEPLTVIAIRWGITPLPPKSLWLIVLRPSGFLGFIPINYSWTNVLREEHVKTLPWEKDIFEYDPRKTYAWENYIWETIDKHNICTDMTTEQVRFSWGAPLKSSVTKGRDGRDTTTYVYRGKTLIFINDTLKNTHEH